MSEKKQPPKVPSQPERPTPQPPCPTPKDTPRPERKIENPTQPWPRA